MKQSNDGDIRVDKERRDAHEPVDSLSFCPTGSLVGVQRRVSFHAKRGSECDKLSPGVSVAQQRDGDFEVGAPYVHACRLPEVATCVVAASPRAQNESA